MVEQTLAVTHFDYSTIEDKDQRGKLINLEGRIKKKRTGMIQSVLDIGEELAQAQAVLANHNKGTFKRWVEACFEFTDTTAYNCINVYTRFRESPQIIWGLSDTTLYLLAAPSTPDKSVLEATKLVDKGVRVTVEVAKELIAKHKPSTNGKTCKARKPRKKTPETPVAPPSECQQNAAGHEWEADGNGSRFCIHCKEDHPDNPQPKPKRGKAGDEFNKVEDFYGKLFRAIDEVANSRGKKGKFHKRCESAMTTLHDAITAWKDAEPEAV